MDYIVIYVHELLLMCHRKMAGVPWGTFLYRFVWRDIDYEWCFSSWPINSSSPPSDRTQPSWTIKSLFTQVRVRQYILFVLHNHGSLKTPILLISVKKRVNHLQMILSLAYMSIRWLCFHPKRLLIMIEKRQVLPLKWTDYPTVTSGTDCDGILTAIIIIITFPKCIIIFDLSLFHYRLDCNLSLVKKCPLSYIKTMTKYILHIIVIFMYSAGRG